MLDERWTRLAQTLVHYSTRVQRGDRVMINMMEVETQPLVEAVYREVVRAGGLPEVYYSSDFLKRALLTDGTLEQVDWVPEVESFGMEWADCYIGLRGARNPYELGDIPTERLAAHRAAMGKISRGRNELTRWVLVKVPNEHFAQQAGMSLEAAMRFFFEASLLDWEEERRRYRELAEVFEAASRVHIIGTDTDLEFSTLGRHYVAGDGEFNMPDGEIFTAPVDDSANGHVWFEVPAMYANKKIPGIRLSFENGVVVEASADENDDFLKQILAMDDGARRLGEFGVGLNWGIQRWTHEVLFDEKIGGTIHLALGRAYAECGGVNESALHWDIVKDLRENGAIELDGRRVFENGRFLV
jgi:aminopeptidase